MRARGIVAAGHPATAAAAAEILADGGNAVDAAIAGIIAATVAEPVLASLGGGGFLVCRQTTGRQAGRTIVDDFFTHTPRRRRPGGDADVRPVDADFGQARQGFRIGLGTIATPGAIQGLFTAAADFGRVPFRRLVEPACRLARQGVRIDGLQASIIRVVAAILESRPEARTLFASPAEPDRLIGENEVFRLPDAADALEMLAIEGADLFYRGEMGRRLVDDCAAAGGHLIADDLARYRVERRAPLAVERFSARISLNPPPAAGGFLVGFSLLTLATGLLRPAGVGGPDHLAGLVPVLAAVDRARRLIAEGADWPAGLPPIPASLVPAARALAGLPQQPRGTTHISVIDAAGNAAALSLSNGEGSGYVLPGTGIMLNNMLGEDDLVGRGGDWPTDRRLASMMAPAVVELVDGGLIALGSGGSSRIRSAIVQVLVNRLVLGLPLAVAVERPRLHLEDGLLSHEPGFPDQALRQVAPMVSRVEAWPATSLFFGGVHAAERDRHGAVTGGGDPRRGGAVRVV